MVVRLRLTHLGLDREYNDYWELCCDVSDPVVLCHVRTPTTPTQDPGAGQVDMETEEASAGNVQEKSPRPKKSGGRKSKKEAPCIPSSATKEKPIGINNY